MSLHARLAHPNQTLDYLASSERSAPFAVQTIVLDGADYDAIWDYTIGRLNALNCEVALLMGNSSIGPVLKPGSVIRASRPVFREASILLI